MTRAALIERVEAASRQARLAGWRAAAAAGMSLAIVESGDLAMAAGSDVPGRAYNRAMGLGPYPEELALAIAFFGDAGTQGWAEVDESTALRAGFAQASIAAADRSGVFAAPLDEVVDGPDVTGIVVREVFAHDLGRWVEAAIAADSPGPARDAWLRRIGPHFLGT
ncbi:MAG: hypothetical protein ACRDGI_04270, partial [Candidatus Limnocylindrales bacterium]